MEDFEKTYKKCQEDLQQKYEIQNGNYFGKYDVQLKTFKSGNLHLSKFRYEDNCKFTYPWQFASR